jgi:signal transduction histidine kinase
LIGIEEVDDGPSHHVGRVVPSCTDDVHVIAWQQPACSTSERRLQCTSGGRSRHGEAATSQNSRTTFNGRAVVLRALWGLWVVPLWYAFNLVLPPGPLHRLGFPVLFILAALPASLFTHRELQKLRAERDDVFDAAERTRHLYETMRYRVQRLTEDLSDAGRQARVAHQMSLLGQFVAGFMHEINNPLGILTGRAEVLLEERRDDEALCRDLREILKEARYVDKIAGTLLPALKRGRSDATFEPALPSAAISHALSALEAIASEQDAALKFEPSDSPRVNLPSHVVEEIIRALVTNALQALNGTSDAQVCLRVSSALPGHSTVVIEVEDDGPGIPLEMQNHLFEPFVSQASHERRSGLGLFIVASLLRMYDGSIRLDTEYKKGARFVLEVPRARFTSEQSYHWFASPLKSGTQETP